MPAEGITKRQNEILEYVKKSILQKGYPPSVREICAAVHLKSTSSVHTHLRSLEKKGYIRRDPAKPRTIEIVEFGPLTPRVEVVSLPIVGTVTAGLPILAQENIEGYCPLPADMLPKDEMFMLRVHGDSMMNAGILNGDTVIVRKQSTANNGEIVCALLDDSATIKTFYKERGRVRLQPQNDAYDPIYTRHCEILGKVIGLLRLNM